MRKRREVLIAILIVALVAGMGGPESIAGRPADPGGSGLLSWLGESMRDLVKARPGPVDAEPISVGLAVDQRTPLGQARPAPHRIGELVDRRAADTRYYELSDGRIQADVVGTAARLDEFRTQVRFPLAGLPANTPVEDAQLKLTADPPAPDDVQLEARAVTGGDVDPQAAANVVQVDDGDPGTYAVGTWPLSTNTDLVGRSEHADYRYNNDRATGDTYTWVPSLTESGDYLVEVHVVTSSDRARKAPVTVDYLGGSQTYLVDETGPDTGEWKALGTHPFAAGTTGRVVLGDIPNKSVVADAVRLTRWGRSTAKPDAEGWISLPVRDVAQDWVNGTRRNDGLMVTATGGSVVTRDVRLVLTFARTGVAVNPPTTITGTGARLDWPAYVDPSTAAGDDLVGYQVHRGDQPTFTPSAATLVAPLAPTALSYQDTTARPTPTSGEPQRRYYYMVAVRTADGRVVPGPTQLAVMPKAGQITRIDSTPAVTMHVSPDRQAVAPVMAAVPAGAQVVGSSGSEVTYLPMTAEATYYAPDTPALTTPATTYPVPVTVSNPTATAWPAADWELTYRWAWADGTAVSNGQGATAVPADIAPGGAADVAAQITTPPSTSDGSLRLDYVLSWELHNKTTGQMLSQLSSIPALDQHVTVDEPTSDELGLEKFYAYSGTDTGAGSSVLNNLHAGNTVWSYYPFTNPSRGLATFLRITYNSLDTSDSSAGQGFSLQPATLTRLGTPLDFHPNLKPTSVRLTDGDGTTHEFTWDSRAGVWISPKGVHLFLQRLVDCDHGSTDPRAWVMTRPDRTRFYFDCDGFQTAVADNNGNELLFTYEQRQSAARPDKFLRSITDPAARQTLTLDYFAKGDNYDVIDEDTWTKQSATDLRNPHIIDQVKRITDISGRTLTFTYTDKGLLGELVDGAGSAQPKVFAFQFDTTLLHKNVKLVRIADPRGNATTVAYNSRPEDDVHFKGTTKTYTNRLGNPTLFAYTDPDANRGEAIHTTVTDAENHTSNYDLDNFGRPTQLVDARNQTTKLGWDAEHNVARIEEANGAVSTRTYDAKTGYLTEIKDAQAVRDGTPGTVLGYQRQLDGHVADLATRTSPEGRTWTFTYTLAGDLATAVDPLGATTADPDDFTTSFTHDDAGQLLTTTDANHHTTTNSEFDATGAPRTVTDARGKSTHLVADERGLLRSSTDPLGKTTTQTYDAFGRGLVLTVPKDQAAGVFLVTPAPVYDANNNVTASTQPNGAVTTAVYDPADQLVSSDASVDHPGDPARHTTYTYDRVGNLRTTTEPKGNLTPDAGDFTTIIDVDEIYQNTAITDAAGHRTTYQYDNVGNLVQVVDPRKNATTDPADFTTRYAYDLAHRPIRTTDALGKFTTTTYDRDGLVTATTDELGNTVQIGLDKRGQVTEVRVPHTGDDDSIVYNTTRYEYDQVGNTTREISPRGVLTETVPDDFATVAIYDELNRVKETQTAFDPTDPNNNTRDITQYTYDDAGRLVKLSQPPSAGQEGGRTDTTYSYFDNDWIRDSTDPFGLVASYDYNQIGQQTERTLTSTTAELSRKMSWSYFPGGQLATQTDEGFPFGQSVVVVDNSDRQNTSSRGLWDVHLASEAAGTLGATYQTHAAGTSTDQFSWQMFIPENGDYEVFVRYPQVSGAATDANFRVAVGGAPDVRVDQTQHAGEWVSIGKYFLTTDFGGARLDLAGSGNGTIVADGVKVVRDNTGAADEERKEYTYSYDPNSNLTRITDNTIGALVNFYDLGYDGVNQVSQLQEFNFFDLRNTSTFGYNENGALTTVDHDRQFSSYSYDARNLVSTVTVGSEVADPAATSATYTYTDRGERLREVMGNGNAVDYTYYRDGRLFTAAEHKADGTLVSEHAVSYDPNGNRSRDVATVMNADNHGAYLSSTYDYTYDARDRIARVAKSGVGAGIETYSHDGNNNITTQSINGVNTTFTYDRDRLQSTTSGDKTLNYGYDPFGRLDTIRDAKGFVQLQNVYDGFDNVIKRQAENGVTFATTTFTYDPFDRTTSKTTFVGAPIQARTDYTYLGLFNQVLEENTAGQTFKDYRYTPWGERLAEVTRNASDNSTEVVQYGYNAHTDVADITDAAGNTKATYGYTAYGADDKPLFTGVDKDNSDPTKEPYNPYRFNSMRVDQGSGTYDMGFRDYDPSIGRFTSRDSYNGALADVLLGLNPSMGNRYAFGAGNPIGSIEYDGHVSDPGPGNLWMDYYLSQSTRFTTADEVLASFGKTTLLGSAAVYSPQGELIHYDNTFFSGEELKNIREGSYESHVEARVRKLFGNLGYLQENNHLIIVVNKAKPPCGQCYKVLDKVARVTGIRITYRAPGMEDVTFPRSLNSTPTGMEGRGITPEGEFGTRASQPSLFDELPSAGPRGGTGPRGGGGGPGRGPRGGGGVGRFAGGAGTVLGVFGFAADLYFLWRYGPCGTGYLPEGYCQQRPDLVA